MSKNRAKYLLSLAMAIVLVGCSSTPVAAEQPRAFVLSIVSWQTPQTAEEYNNRGLNRQNSGDLDGAIADYTKALSLKAKAAIQATVYNNRANAYMAKNDLAAAITDYGNAIELQPSEFENYFNRGIALL